MATMERIQAINPDRILLCCKDYGISPEALAIEIGIAAESMKQLLVGQGSLTLGQLQKLGAFFQRGILFFLETAKLDEMKIHSSQFRTLANQKPLLSSDVKMLIERVEKQREVYLSLREELESGEKREFITPNLTAHQIRESAGIVRQWLKLGNQNNFDTYRKSVEARGILVFRSNGYKGKWNIEKENPILGFSIYYEDTPVIFLKKQSSDAPLSFTLMHELGHLLLHKSSSIDEEIDLESHQGTEAEANAFAGFVLVPDDFLRKISDASRPRAVDQFDDWLLKYRQEWGVSTEVILRRLLDAKRLTAQQYNAYRNWRNKNFIPYPESGNRQYRNREPMHIFGDKFVHTVFDALNERHITLVKASSYLDNLKIKDLHSLERFYAGL